MIAAVDNAADLLTALVDEKPDVAVVDVRLPPTFTDEGLKAAIEARRQVPGPAVLVLSQYVEQLCARELLADQAGTVGTCSRTGCSTTTSSPTPSAPSRVVAPS